MFVEGKRYALVEDEQGEARLVPMAKKVKVEIDEHAWQGFGFAVWSLGFDLVSGGEALWEIADCEFSLTRGDFEAAAMARWTLSFRLDDGKGTDFLLMRKGSGQPPIKHHKEANSGGLRQRDPTQ